MTSVSKTILVGRLGKEVEVKVVGDKKVANFSIATSESYKDKSGEKKEVTEWHNIVMWSPLAEIAEKYLTKGSQVYVEGKNRTRSYEKDGSKRYVTEVVVNQMTMLGGGKKTESSSEGVVTEATVVDETSNDLPF